MAFYDKKRKSWRACISLGGQKKQPRGFATREDAEAWEKQEKQNFNNEALGLLSRTSSRSIEQIFSVYLQKEKTVKKPSSWARDKTCINHWKKFFDYASIRDASELDERVVFKFIEWRCLPGKKIPKKQTLNTDMKTLRVCLRYAVKENLINKNPLEELPLYKESELDRRDRVALQINHIKDIEEAAKNEKKKTCLYEAISILLRTGMRSNELCTLELDDVDFVNRYIILDSKKTKNKESRTIPFDDKVLDILEGLKVKAKEAGRNYFIHTRTGGKQTPSGLLRRFRNLLNKMKNSSKMKIFENLNIHDLRSTYISHLLEEEDAEKVMDVVGHKDWRTTKRYFKIINRINPNSLKY